MSEIVIVICQATGGDGKVDEKELRFGNNEIEEGREANGREPQRAGGTLMEMRD